MGGMLRLQAKSEVLCANDRFRGSSDHRPWARLLPGCLCAAVVIMMQRGTGVAVPLSSLCGCLTQHPTQMLVATCIKTRCSVQSCLTVLWTPPKIPGVMAPGFFAWKIFSKQCRSRETQQHEDNVCFIK